MQRGEENAHSYDCQEIRRVIDEAKMFSVLAYLWRWQFYDFDFIISASDALFVIYYY